MPSLTTKQSSIKDVRIKSQKNNPSLPFLQYLRFRSAPLVRGHTINFEKFEVFFTNNKCGRQHLKKPLFHKMPALEKPPSPFACERLL